MIQHFKGQLSPVFLKHATLVPIIHWGRATHIYVSKLTIIASDNGLSPGRRQTIIWNNAGILLIGLLGTKFSEILIEILTFSFKKMRLKVSSAKWRPFCLGLNVIMQSGCDDSCYVTITNRTNVTIHYTYSGCQLISSRTKWPPIRRRYMRH